MGALRPGRVRTAMSWRTRRRVVAPSDHVAGHVLPCHSVWACRVAAPPSRHRELCHNTTHVARVARRVAALLHRIAGRCCAVSQPCCAVLQHKRSPPHHDTKFCITTPPVARPCHSPTAPCRGMPLRTTTRLVSRYNLLYRDSTPYMGSTPFQPPLRKKKNKKIKKN